VKAGEWDGLYEQAKSLAAADLVTV
jgi:hypothetical protein